MTIPDRYTLNASAHYNWRRIATDFRLDVFNFTNQDNFSPIFDGGFLPRRLPIQPRCHYSLLRV